MNSLCQLESGIIATEQALYELAEKTAARILVLSDSHGGRETVRSILRHFSARCDALVFAGDGIGDIADCLDGCAADGDSSASLPPVAAFAKGNNDPAFYPLKNATLRVPRRVLFKAAGRTLLVVHGSEQGIGFGTRTVEEEARLEGADGVIFGHTHIPYESMRRIYLLNPGSCTRPRQLSACSFALLELSPKSISATFYRISGTQGSAATPYLLP